MLIRRGDGIGRKASVWNQLSPRKTYRKALKYKNRKNSPIICGMHWSAIYGAHMVERVKLDPWRQSYAEMPYDMAMVHARIFRHKHKQETWE